LKHPVMLPKDRCNALFLLAHSQADRGDYSGALETLKEQVRMRRHSADWALMARCQEMLGRKEDQIRSLTTAVPINAALRELHAYLAGYHRSRGDHARADWHQERAGP